MKKVAVIGANSYIARNIIYRMGKLREVDWYLYDKDEKHADGCGKYQSVNLLSKESVSSIDMRMDMIFVFVGKTGSSGGFDDPGTFIDVNEKVLIYILDEYRRQKSEGKIIFPSTRLLYVNNADALENDITKELRTIYAMNKYACEQYLKMYHNMFNIKYIVFRICIPYGSYIAGASSYGTVSFMINRARAGEDIILYGDGDVRRTLTYVGDLCDEIIFAVECEECVNNIFNIGGEDYSLKEMAEVIAEKYDVGVKHIPYPDYAKIVESGDTVFNSNKLDYVINYERKVKFENWVRTLI